MRKYKGLIICLYVMGVFSGCNSPYSATLEEADGNRKELGKKKCTERQEHMRWATL